MKNNKPGVTKNDIFSLVTRYMKEKGVVSPSRISIGAPAYDEKELNQAIDSLLDVWISMGPKVKSFEKQAAKYVGTKYAVAVNSGSSANLIALATFIAVHKIPRGSEVIMPATTFATVASPVIQLGLVPVYVDIDKNSWNIDPTQIEKAISKNTRIIMPVHTFGNPADMDLIKNIAKKHKLLILEDACEAHGASIRNRKVPSFGDMGTWSFFVAHNITTGEGGMVFTNNEEYYNALISLREFGRMPAENNANKRLAYEDKYLGRYDTRYIFIRLGYNVRMTDIAASLGIEQLKKLDDLNAMRFERVNRYMDALKTFHKYLELPSVKKNTVHSFYGFPFIIRKDSPFSRRDITSFLEDRNIETRPFFAGCLPDQPGFRIEPHRTVGKLPISRWARDNGIFVGCHPMLSNTQERQVIQAFRDFFLEKGLK